MHYQFERSYNDLKEKTDYLVDKLKKVLDKLPQIIKDIVDRMFTGYMDLKFFKQQYDSEEKDKAEKERKKRFRIFGIKQKDTHIYEKDYRIEKSNEKDAFER